MGTKLMMVFTLQYGVYGLILSLAYFFLVPKEEMDIWMVHNGTSSRMNAHPLAPCAGYYDHYYPLK
jgi:hypothetical protein